MHCTHCGALLPENAKFCTSCGERVEAAPVQEPSETYSAFENASEGYKAASAQLPPSYSDPNYSSQAKNPYAVPASSSSNGLAIAGFVCSLIFWPFTIGFFTAIAGFVLSIMGLNSAKKLPENKGHGLALAGTIISAIRIALLLIGIILLIVLMVRGIGYAGHEIISNWSDYVPYYH